MHSVVLWRIAHALSAALAFLLMSLSMVFVAAARRARDWSDRTQNNLICAKAYRKVARSRATPTLADNVASLQAARARRVRR